MKTLLAILSLNRTSELTYLGIRNIVFKENSVIFHFSKLNKFLKKGISPLLKGFEKAELCVIRCLKQYLLITNLLRSEKTIQLLVSYIALYNLVSVYTVSRCLKEFLRHSGVDISIFTGHSTRAASASKAKRLGLSLPEILKRSQWTNSTTFETWTANQLWIIQWKFCKVNSFVWASSSIQYYID